MSEVNSMHKKLSCCDKLNQAVDKIHYMYVNANTDMFKEENFHLISMFVFLH